MANAYKTVRQERERRFSHQASAVMDKMPSYGTDPHMDVFKSKYLSKLQSSTERLNRTSATSVVT